jgi:hypothetical protein
MIFFFIYVSSNGFSCEAGRFLSFSKCWYAKCRNFICIYILVSSSAHNRRNYQTPTTAGSLIIIFKWECNQSYLNSRVQFVENCTLTWLCDKSVLLELIQNRNSNSTASFFNKQAPFLALDRVICMSTDFYIFRCLQKICTLDFFANVCGPWALIFIFLFENGSRNLVVRLCIICIMELQHSSEKV